MNTILDTRFESHFSGRLRQIFMYVTDECNLRCTQCYYHPWLKPWNPAVEMPFRVAVALLSTFRSLGAIKLSLLGGEPTRYGHRRGKNPPLSSLVRAAKEQGFQYIRLVTNGLFPATLLDDPDLALLDEITFSIDGDQSDIHDPLRGPGTFERTIANVKRALSLGIRVHITTCVHRLNVGRTQDGKLLLVRAIRWAEGLGVNLINFHPLFKMGIPRDSWTNETDVSSAEWQSVYREVSDGVSAGLYRIPVRLPQRFVSAAEFLEDPEYYGYCPVKMAERLEVHVNGQLHSCALHNGTPISLAKFRVEANDLYIDWAAADNEIARYAFDMSRPHPCVVMQRDYGPLVPLCISFKPDQEEPVWKSLGIDDRRGALRERGGS